MNKYKQRQKKIKHLQRLAKSLNGRGLDGYYATIKTAGFVYFKEGRIALFLNIYEPIDTLFEICYVNQYSLV